MKQSYHPAWDLEVIFPGGSRSHEFRTYMDGIKVGLEHFYILVDGYIPSEQETNQPQLGEVIEKYAKLKKQFSEASAFISCLSAQDMQDEQANVLVAERSELGATFSGGVTKLIEKCALIDDQSWDNMMKQSHLKAVSYVLSEARDEAKDKLPIDQEMLINDLSVDGYQGWGQMYDVIVGNMNVAIKEDGETNDYSVGQAANKLNDPKRSVRKHVFEQLDKSWRGHGDLFGQTLNHLAGFRIQTYKHRGWDDILKEPLTINRMKQTTLDVMWKAISDHKPAFISYINRKAELLEIDKLSIYDIEAPLTSTEEKLSYTDGANFIVNHFRKFSPKMADFAQMAFEKRWIEAEDRDGKRPGGFCTSFPDSEQTRIFMTYSGTASNIATLAHELGHAYHQHVMNDMHALNQGYAMNVAETASTFAEMVVADASVQNAKDKDEKIGLLEDKIQRSVAFFMNIHSRFIFEQRFYEERKDGMVPVTRLNELMVEAQKEAYCDSLSEYDPTFWSSKLHFHITGVPFYNFPYTFGYLFSLGIYAHAQEQGDSFEDDYIALLRDTGRMNVEELAARHLDVDLTQPDFWEHAIQLCIQDVEEFMSLTAE